MLREEFEARTGFYPTGEHYAAIEAAYSIFKGDKDVFCKAYKKNKDGMAEAIARDVSIKRILADWTVKSSNSSGNLGIIEESSIVLLLSDYSHD